MVTRTLSVAPLAVATVLLAQSPADAARCDPRPGRVHVVVRMSDAVVNDFLELTYSVTVTNLGPDTATGLVLHRSSRYCATPSTPLAGCVALPPADHRPVDLGPGRSATFLATAQLAVTRPQTVRSTVEVVHVDQDDVASVPGTCAEGTRPQDDCATVVTVLT